MIEEAIFCHFDEDEMPKIVMSNGWKKKIKFKDFSISLCFFVFFVAILLLFSKLVLRSESQQLCVRFLPIPVQGWNRW